MDDLLIVGIDPGTTIGIACHTLYSQKITLFSARNITTAACIERILSCGYPVILGTDKAKVPGKVHEIASRLAIRVASPAADLRMAEKKALVSETDVQPANTHERDALAAARYAYNNYRGYLRKIAKHTAHLDPEQARHVSREAFRDETIPLHHIVERLTRIEPEPQAPVRRSEQAPPDIGKLMAERDALRERLTNRERDIRALKDRLTQLERNLSYANTRLSQAQSGERRSLAEENRRAEERARSQRIEAHMRRLRKIIADKQLVGLRIGERWLIEKPRTAKTKSHVLFDDLIEAHLLRPEHAPDLSRIVEEYRARRNPR